MKPSLRPQNPNFSSGPCAKRPGWSFAGLEGALLGRSHRASVGKARLKEVIDRTGAVLGIPADFRIAIVPASDTGAVEMALWGILGARGVDMLTWESFGKGWVSDVKSQLKLKDVRVFESEYGTLPDLGQVDAKNRDVVFTWNGTTSGVRVPNGEWIPTERDGVTICDATSAAFAMRLPWEKLDVTTWSWQKAMGGEAAHGMMVLSPRAAARLESYTPAWPMPKIFRLTKGGKLIEGTFAGETLNTPSMLCVEDAIDALKWMESIGGQDATVKRAEASLAAISAWVAKTPWVEFLARDPATRSCTSVCLSITDPAITALAEDKQLAFTKALSGKLEKEKVAYDINGYRDAPPGLRIWTGSTVEPSDVEALLPWIDWAFAETKPDFAAKAA
jgi:phosphoserine aminotransferase